MPFSAQPTEKCTACQKTVYLTERSIVEEKTDKKVYHKTCIRCQTCNKVLGVGQYCAMDGKFWCKPHFSQLFATKGNYDEAFGKERKYSTADATAKPTSFVPETKTTDPKGEPKAATSEATAAKFRQFREQGDSDKCSACAKTVYLAEKMLVEDKNDKRLFHKACFKCADCNLILDLRNYGSVEGKIYCKNHLKDHQKQNPTGYIATPSSFVPETKEEKTTQKTQTPDNIANKFKGLGAGDKCKSCGKSVYLAEKVTLPESLKQQAIYHKTCLKCSICDIQLGVSNYGSSQGALFCTVHLKQFGKPEQAKGDGAYFVSPLASTDANYVPGPREGDFNPKYSQDDEPTRNVDEDRSSDREPEDRESDRETNQEEQREEARSYSPQGRSSPAIERGDSGRSSPAIERATGSGRSSPALQGRSSPALEKVDSEDESEKREKERQRKREERQRQIDEEARKEEEEREQRKRERERRLAETESGATGEDDDRSKREAEREERRRKREEERKRDEEERERQDAQRKKEREDRRRQQEEESKLELEEQERKAEERRKKLAELRIES